MPNGRGSGPGQTPRAVVIPFPAARRVGFIRKNARHAATFARPEAVEKYITDRAVAAYTRLVKAGVPHDVATADTDALWDALWRAYDRATAEAASYGGGGDAA